MINKLSSATIAGATDGTLIGNVADRLKVDGSISPIPSQNVIYSCTSVTNAGSSNMAVNGSVTPVNFDFTPASGETWYLERITLFLQDNGTTTPTAFGSIAGGLTNGVDIRFQSGGTEYLYANVKNNIDISMCFRDNYYVPGTSGLFETSDLVICQVIFQVPIRLSNASADFARVRIRDNLTVLDQFRGGVVVWRSP